MSVQRYDEKQLCRIRRSQDLYLGTERQAEDRRSGLLRKDRRGMEAGRPEVYDSVKDREDVAVELRRPVPAGDRRLVP